MSSNSCGVCNQDRVSMFCCTWRVKYLSFDTCRWMTPAPINRCKWQALLAWCVCKRVVQSLKYSKAGAESDVDSNKLICVIRQGLHNWYPMYHIHAQAHCMVWFGTVHMHMIRSLCIPAWGVIYLPSSSVWSNTQQTVMSDMQQARFVQTVSVCDCFLNTVTELFGSV